MTLATLRSGSEGLLPLSAVREIPAASTSKPIPAWALRSNALLHEGEPNKCTPRGLGNEDPFANAEKWARPGSSPRWPHLERVPACSGGRGLGM
jgi:hypothetical protein